MKKIVLLFLLFAGCYFSTNAQVRDSVTIVMPPYTDTTCYGTELTFTAIESSDTFHSVHYDWYTDGTFYTSVTIDTFLTTALTDGDSVFCWIVFTNSFGFLDSTKSNTIIVHRVDSLMPGVSVSLIVGSNPDCAGHPLTFEAYPVNGGSSPTYQWMIDGSPVAGADSATFSRVFGDPDTISCFMVSNSTCLGTYNDTASSNVIPIIHYHLTDSVRIVDTKNPICAGAIDTFTATYYNPGAGFSLAWFVNGVVVPGVIGNTFMVSTLRNGDYVYCVLTTPDPCISTDSTVSNVVTMTVLDVVTPTISTALTHGSNPGCLDSSVTFSATYTDFGVNPVFEWFVNDTLVDSNSTTLDTFYKNGDVVTFKVYVTDTGCYSFDTAVSRPVLMIRDSTPPQPWVSLIVNNLVANSGGTYDWYYSISPTGPFTIQPGFTTQTIHPNNTGYWYAVKDTGNCFSIPSNIIYIALLGVPVLNMGQVHIYPNPTSGILNLDFPSAVSMKMDLYSIIGQGLLHEDISNTAHFATDLSYLPDGDYILVLRDSDGSAATYKIQLVR